MAQTSSTPASPTTTTSKHKQSALQTQSESIIPLDAPQRTHPIHPSIPSIKLSSTSDGTSTTTLNPLTLKPFTAEELKTHNYKTLKEQYSTPEEARQAQEEALKELKERLEGSERRTKEIEREMEEKEKTREIERKVYMKKLGKDGGV